MSNTMDRMTALMDAMERERRSREEGHTRNREETNHDLRRLSMTPRREDTQGIRRDYQASRRVRRPGKEHMTGENHHGERSVERARRSDEEARDNRRFRTITPRALTYGTEENRRSSGQRKEEEEEIVERLQEEEVKSERDGNLVQSLKFSTELRAENKPTDLDPEKKSRSSTQLLFRLCELA